MKVVNLQKVAENVVSYHDVETATKKAGYAVLVSKVQKRIFAIKKFDEVYSISIEFVFSKYIGLLSIRYGLRDDPLESKFQSEIVEPRISSVDFFSEKQKQQIKKFLEISKMPTFFIEKRIDSTEQISILSSVEEMENELLSMMAGCGGAHELVRSHLQREIDRSGPDVIEGARLRLALMSLPDS